MSSLSRDGQPELNAAGAGHDQRDLTRDFLTSVFDRRALLRGSLSAGAVGLGASWIGAFAAAGGAWATTGAPDPTRREAFDLLDQSFNNGDGWKRETNDKDSSGLSGKLAWGEAYVLQAYALMYERYRDPRYLDKMVDHIDHVLANRDSERGVTDYQGHSHPAWRADHHYTTGKVAVPDEDGRPALEVRTAMAYADDAVATVSAGSSPGTFRLDVTHHFYARTTTYDGLTMDPRSPDYAVDRVLRGFRSETPARVQVTVKDLRQGATGPVNLALGEHPLVSPPYVFEAHTGQIVLPLVLFARMVHADPRLYANARYRQRAAAYVRAAEEAVAVHDAQWRENDEGEGYYVTLPGSPAWWAGTDTPVNQFLALGRAMAQLAAITRAPILLDRVGKMARLLRNDLRVDAGGAYVWSYWWSKGAVYRGWDIDAPASEYRPWLPGNPSAEDTSHGQIDMNFALEVFRDSALYRGTPVFTGEDMSRFAATFTRNVAATTPDGLPTVNRNVDGTGGTGLKAYESQSAAWAGLTPWDGAVLAHLRNLFLQTEFDLTPSLLYCVARLNHASRRRG